MRNIAELARAMRACRVSKILKTERQTERKHDVDSVGECTPFECASVDSWQRPRLSNMQQAVTAGFTQNLFLSPLNGTVHQSSLAKRKQEKAMVGAIHAV